MAGLLAETTHWQEESRIAHIQNRMAQEYDIAHRQTIARRDAAHEARWGRPAIR